MKRKVFLGLCILILSSGCVSNSSQKIGADITWACTLLTDPDEYRVGVLMVIGAAKENPEILSEDRGNPYNYINNVVREFKGPGVTDGLEARDIKNRFADALDVFAAAYTLDVDEIRLQASENLTEVSKQLRERCTTMGFEFTEQWPKD
jgi:hypothetical protein